MKIMADEISTLMTNSKDKVVLLRLRNNKTVQGTLKDFDIHMNLTLENAEDVSEEKPNPIGKVLLRGDNILAISLPEEESN
ncbi:Like-Sm ribonucleoprotein core [Nitrosopumilus maritimus SCM1]|uniref:Like-Sm ribonucleoprotein core n=2 Tax=Nitrosopumilus maritimus TaxID=338192 RepID=A9A461_NITMS|nr:Like-Sm ribonucleoprotein core [Nitrosopumilus maritimus SCM1]